MRVDPKRFAQLNNEATKLGDLIIERVAALKIPEADKMPVVALAAANVAASVLVRLNDLSTRPDWETGFELWLSMLRAEAELIFDAAEEIKRERQGDDESTLH